MNTNLMYFNIHKTSLKCNLMYLKSILDTLKYGVFGHFWTKLKTEKQKYRNTNKNISPYNTLFQKLKKDIIRFCQNIIYYIILYLKLFIYLSIYLWRSNYG